MYVKVNKTEEEWKKQLTPQQYNILREKGTEPPFTGEYVDNHEDGMYVCAACGAELFDSGTKFESGSGWPSFYDVASHGNVILQDDNSHGMERTEVVCANCGGHLGHLFNDGPSDKTGLRYCINSCALKFNGGD
jgi:peptide-methionine (R)-S-oxide reductase